MVFDTECDGFIFQLQSSPPGLIPFSVSLLWCLLPKASLFPTYRRFAKGGSGGISLLCRQKTERERQAETKNITGVFTGSYGINPFTEEKIPIWISEYVLSGYGTGAIMGVPAHDSRDYAFAKKFNLPIIPLIEGADVSEESFDATEGIMMNSGFMNGMDVNTAIEAAKVYVEENKLGHRKTNYRLRDAIFSRQRYWGEPFSHLL